MSKFEKTQIKISEEIVKSAQSKNIQVDPSATIVVKEFAMHPLRKLGEGDYAVTKAKYGPLAATDSDRVNRKQKDRRFSLDSLLRDPLSVGQEEHRAIEEKVQARVEALAEEAKAKAAEHGYKEGLRLGYEEAFRKVQEDAKINLTRLNQLVDEAENAKVKIYQANERFLIELILRIARTVILRELATDQEYIVRLAKELVERVGVRDNLKIRINPEDMKTIEMLKGGLEKSFGKLNNLNIEPSMQVPKGGCQIETEWNAMDASIEGQLQAIYGSMTGKSGGDP